MEFKGTKGEWELSRVNGELITTEDTNVCRVFAMEMREGQANAKLISCAPELLQALNESNKVIRSLKMSMMAHPDCEPNYESEMFDGYGIDFYSNYTQTYMPSRLRVESSGIGEDWY